MGRWCFVFNCTLVCVLSLCYAAPKGLNAKRRATKESKIVPFLHGLHASKENTRTLATVMRNGRGRKTMLAKLHNEKESKAETSTGVTRLSASGDYRKGHEESLGGSDEYWGDMAGETSSLDHNLENIKGEDNLAESGKKSSKTDHGSGSGGMSTRRGNPSTQGDFSRAISGAEGNYKSKTTKTMDSATQASHQNSATTRDRGSIKRLISVKKSNHRRVFNSNEYNPTDPHLRRSATDREYEESLISGNGKYAISKIAVAVKNTDPLAGKSEGGDRSETNLEDRDSSTEKIKASVSHIKEAVGDIDKLTQSKTVLEKDHERADAEDSIGPYIANFNGNAKAKDGVFRSLENAYVRSVGENHQDKWAVEEVSGSNDDDDELIDLHSGSDEDIESEDSALSGDYSSKSKAILTELDQNVFKTQDSSGNFDKQHDAIKGHKVVVGERDHKGSHNTSAYAPQRYLPVRYAHPSLKYVYVPISNAAAKGAVCLDGSIPGYFYRSGFGTGARKWILYLAGGAWCDSEMNCYNRSKTHLGSSLHYSHLMNAEGILSHDGKKNEHFYNWNIVYVPYCDGASFSGNRTDPLVVKDKVLYFRGKRILSALLDQLLTHGLEGSTDVVFTGTSAGALAAMLNADYVRHRLPSSSHVLALADSGVFLDLPNINGIDVFAKSMKRVYELHESSGSINPKCAAREGEKHKWRCLFPAAFGEFLATPLYIINPLYDSWQLVNIVGIHCVYHPKTCSKEHMKIIKEFRKKTLDALKPILNNKMIGVFGDGCIDHGQIIFSQKWDQIRVRKRSMQGAFYRWSKNTIRIRELVDPDVHEDDSYPFNPTCWSQYDQH